MATPRFTRGELVWRPVLCSRDQAVRNKLILDIYPHAFDSFGIELLCRRVKDARQVNEVNGKKIYAVNLEPDVVKVQKICHNAHHEGNDQPRAPLYFPRAGTFNNIIKMDRSSDYAYFIQLTEVVPVRGQFGSIYVVDPLTQNVARKDILDITLNSNRSMLILDDMSNEPMSRFLRGAIHGEVRCATRLYRLSPDRVPPAAAALGPHVGSASCPVYSSSNNSNLQVPVEDLEHQLVAIKTIRKTALRHDVRGHERPLDEIGAMYHIHHAHGGNYSNIVRLLHCIMEDYAWGDEDDVGSEMDVGAGAAACSTMEITDTRNFEGNSYVVMPYFTGGELFDQIAAMPRDYYRIHDCFRQVALGVRYMHGARFNHRDLSCENVLCHTDLQAKEGFHVIDFGMSVHIPEAHQSSTSPLRTSGSIRGDGMLYGHRVCGKPLYIPAEHFLEKDPHNNPTLGFPSDVWALGVILFILVTGTGPFGNPVGLTKEGLRSNYVGWLREIKYDTIGDRRCPAALPHTGCACLLRHHPCYSLLKRMLSWPEGDRITIEQVLADEWVHTGGRNRAGP
jgi:serine/threonine protein kinase